ncbi:hypothetical protein [Stenotrophomonas maltophilia]|uniref:hypothetical protein n=1 Tax=Stenotrophomonas maltophilia TaxID=40324 RepID=UPI00128DBBE5|nr:hypothetical protein [Stenotrophomonas maltophilia]MBH1465347.1 hypothetical protein [Stenotrophomonas maltophilia]MBH1613035.1 hypothetical protein [Stenotrophomonas maltophilia]MBN5167265.1 hypothetical protein [Stenotrophomonas maltophilia]
MAEMPTKELAKAVLGYLGLFKPPKSSLRLQRAVKIAQDVAELVATGDVCRDERTGVRRPAGPAVWTAGIEQMLAQRSAISLPLDSHGYLRAVVYGLADKQDAAAERKREEDTRSGKHLARTTGTVGIDPSPNAETPLQRQLAWIAQMEEFEQYTAEEAEEERRKAYAKHGEQ